MDIIGRLIPIVVALVTIWIYLVLTCLKRVVTVNALDIICVVRWRTARPVRLVFVLFKLILPLKLMARL